MIDISNYHLKLPAVIVEERNENTIPTLSILLFDYNAFRNEVFFFRSHYQGPDYFGILENISELESLLDSIIQQLKSQVGDLKRSPYRTISNSLEYRFEKHKVQFNSDSEGITLILLGLSNLIKTNRKAAFEAEELEEFFIKSLLLGFEKELEKSKWIFHLFSKY